MCAGRSIEEFKVGPLGKISTVLNSMVKRPGCTYCIDGVEESSVASEEVE